MGDEWFWSGVGRKGWLLTYNPSNPPSSLEPGLQRYLVQELRRIATEITRASESGGDGPGPGPGDTDWGQIGGTLSDQLDLQDELDGKAPTVHTHTAAQTISGTFLDARIPNLNASKTNAGTFLDARIPNLNASKITAGRFPPARWMLAQAHVTWVAGNATMAANIGVNNVNAGATGFCTVTLNLSNPSFATQRVVLITGQTSGARWGAVMTNATQILVTSQNQDDTFQDNSFFICAWDT